MLTREQIIQKLGIEKLPKDQQDAQLELFANNAHQRIIRKISEQLDDNDLQTLSALIDAQKDDEIEAFIKGKIPNYDQWAADIQLKMLDSLENNRTAIKDEIEAKALTTPPTE